ncbi:glycosyltransferase family 2 protein [Lactobacillus sp. PV034]|uniref:glycosyltransferase family 2 protein n=1 Tax=Lactobacillus sp. PV034 TaxID=2594495 RepID=UPI00223FB03F|nr:glycosyltransferase family A protein [Lactobacillus sp. PV034]QNQ80528.1 glycosyltransferase family 2 protein [Lactobacillus sp. PV034]
MKKQPLISVIVPVYNDEKYLSLCLDSLLNQNYKNLEIILIDDGSEDSSLKILNNYSEKDKRINVYHKKNTGVSDTRNYGLERANGEYICFSDADDILTTDYVSYLYKLLICYHADIALTRKMYSNFNKKQVKKNNEMLVSGKDAARDILTYNIPIGVYSKLFKHDFLIKNKIKFDTELYIGEGFNFNFDAFMAANKVVVSDKKIYYYRRDNETSATTRFSMKKWENGLYAIKKIKNKLDDNPSEQLINAWNFAWWRTNSDVYDNMVLANAQQKYPDIFDRIMKVTKKQALIAWNVSTSKQNRLRATMMRVCPLFIPLLLKLRKKKL